MESKHKYVGFSIKEILGDEYYDTSEDTLTITTPRSKAAPARTNVESTKNSILWLHLYWESIRQYYQALSAMAPHRNFDFTKPGHILAPWFYNRARQSFSQGLNHIGITDLDGDKSMKEFVAARAIPLDSPLFQLEKLASTRLSTWNSEFCPLKSLLEKKSSSQSRRRKSRTAFTAHQLAELEKVFRKQKYLTPSDRDRIAACLSLSSAQVITWFQNRRAKFKRDLEEMHNDLLYAGKMKRKGKGAASTIQDENETNSSSCGMDEPNANVKIDTL